MIQQPKPLQTPFEVDLRITKVWQVNNPTKNKGVLTKYRVEDAHGNLIGVFHTPSTSALSDSLFAIANKRKLGS